MNTTLDSYSKSISEAQTLGHIGWYSLPDPHITHADMVELARKVGMPEKHLPGPPRPADAFKRAMRKSDRSKNKPKPLQRQNEFYTFLVRPVSMTGDDLEVHLVLEVLNKSGKKLHHNDVAGVRYSKSSDHYAESVFPVYETHHEFRPLIDEMLVDFRDEFKQALVEVEPQSIRNTIRSELWDMHALNVRSRGGIYFIPRQNKKRLESLEAWVTGMGADFHTIPLPDNSKQKDMIIQAFENDVHEQAHETIQQLNKLLLSNTKIPPSIWARYKKRLDDLTARTSQYSDLIEEEMEKAGTELILLQQKVMEVLKSDLITEGRSKK